MPPEDRLQPVSSLRVTLWAVPYAGPCHRKHCVSDDHRAIRSRFAFTLIELIAAVGVVLLLLGLLLPMAGRSMANARMTRDAAVLRQNAGVVALYGQDWAEVFPVADRSPAVSAYHWYRAVRRSGHLSSAREADPAGWDRSGKIRFAMSMCLVYDPDLMDPLRPVQPNETRSVPIRHSQLLYPSSKGVLLMMNDGRGLFEEGGRWFCCSSRWKVPVAMGDGSVIVGDHLDFSFGRPVIVTGALGIPVFSTWGGYRARDR